MIDSAEKKNSNSHIMMYPLTPLEYLILLEHQHILQDQSINPRYLGQLPHPNPLPQRTIQYNTQSCSSTQPIVTHKKDLIVEEVKIEPETQLIEKVTSFISTFLSDYSFEKIFEAFDSYQRSKTSYQVLNNKIAHSPVPVLNKPQKHKNELSDYSYLKTQKLPQQIDIKVPFYDPERSPYYDMLAISEDELTQEGALRMKEMRFAADTFCSKGYGINFFREAITDKNYILNKERYKSVLGAMVRLGFRSIEKFLLFSMKKNASALKRAEVKALLTPLLNIRTQFEQKHQQTFLGCLRTSFKLKTEPVFDQDVLDFYKAVVAKTRGSAFAEIVDKQLTPSQKQKIQNLVFESKTLWTAELERQFVQLYLKNQSYGSIRDELQKKYCPRVESRHFQFNRIRARGDKIFISAIRRGNMVLERAGIREEMIPLPDRLKKLISRSPVAADIRLDLCRIYLSDNVSIQLVSQTIRKIKKIVANNSLFNSHNGQLPPQQSNNMVNVRSDPIIYQKHARGRRRRMGMHLVDQRPREVKIEEEESLQLSDPEPVFQSPLRIVHPKSKQIKRSATIIKLQPLEHENIYYSDDDSEYQTKSKNKKHNKINQESDCDSLLEMDKLIQMQARNMELQMID